MSSLKAAAAVTAPDRTFSKAVCERINQRIDRERRHWDAERTWLPSLVEQQRPLRLDHGYLEPRLPYFRTMLLEGGPVVYPDAQSVHDNSWFSIDPLKHIVRSHRDLSRLQRQHAAVLRRAGARRVDFDEDLIGWPYHSRRWLLWGKPKTAACLHNSLYYSLLAHLVDLTRVSTIVDIGGGFGSLLGAVLSKQPHIRGRLVEMPYLCAIASYYLGRKFGDVILADEEPADGSARVSVMLPWVFDTLTTAPDLAINTMSFQHMAQANHEYYFSNLARLGVKKVFSVNRELDTREGEAPFMPTARKYGFRLGTTLALDPWSGTHRAHLLVT
jgi:putative sugar O-methyltransferase